MIGLRRVADSGRAVSLEAEDAAADAAAGPSWLQRQLASLSHRRWRRPERQASA